MRSDCNRILIWKNSLFKVFLQRSQSENESDLKLNAGKTNYLAKNSPKTTNTQ